MALHVMLPLCDLPSSERVRIKLVCLVFSWNFYLQAFSWVRVSWFASLQGLAEVDVLCSVIDEVMEVIWEINTGIRLTPPSPSTASISSQFGCGEDKAARSQISTTGGGSVSGASQQRVDQPYPD